MVREVLMSLGDWGMEIKVEAVESVKYVWEIKLIFNYEEFCILL